MKIIAHGFNIRLETSRTLDFPTHDRKNMRFMDYLREFNKSERY